MAVPATAWPRASLALTKVDNVSPIRLNATVWGETLNVVATCATVTATVSAARSPCAAAITDVEPSATAVTRPVVGFTVAAAGLLELHAIVTPPTDALTASLACAASVTVSPMEVRVPGALGITTAAIRTRRFLVAVMPVGVPFCTASAVMVTLPRATPVTTPLRLTVALALFADQRKVTPVVAGAPPADAAAASAVVPAITTVESPDRLTRSTGAGPPPLSPPPQLAAANQSMPVVTKRRIASSAKTRAQDAAGARTARAPARNSTPSCAPPLSGACHARGQRGVLRILVGVTTRTLLQFRHTPHGRARRNHERRTDPRRGRSHGPHGPRRRPGGAGRRRPDGSRPNRRDGREEPRREARQVRGRGCQEIGRIDDAERAVGAGTGVRSGAESPPVGL